MNFQISQTGFVDAGTALANMTSAMPGRSRNIFVRSTGQDMVDVTNSIDAAVDTFTPHAPHAQSASKLGWAIEPKPVLSVPQQITLPLTIWEGVVEEVDYDSQHFYAHLTSKGTDLEEHRVEMMISAVEPSDLELLAPGAVFYLEQYQRNRRGGREQTQILRFRRCVTWTQHAIDWAKNEAKAMNAVLKPYVEPKDDDE